MMGTARSVAVGLIAVALALPRAARSGGGELALFDLDEQLKAETTVASSAPRSIRETPGVVTLVSRDEILAVGARNLFDVLQLVPGFQVGGEIGNTTGLGFRGLWGAEGKVLVLVDGIPMNDLLYGGAQADAIPVEQVASLEVVRGPGSALYGGFAELAVVNITTRSAAELAGGALSASYGQMGGGFGRRTGTVGYGWTGETSSATAQITAGQEQRSDRSYQDATGAGFSMAGDSAVDPLTVNVGGSWRGLRLRALYADWRNQTGDGYGNVIPAPLEQHWRTLGLDARYEQPLAPGLTLAPRLSYLRTTPWQQLAQAGYGLYDKTAERFTGRLALAWRPSPSLEWVMGGEAYYEHAFLNEPQTASLNDFGGHSWVELRNVAAFGELGWDTPVGNLLAGARLERHDRFGSSFVPRLAVTKLLAPFHLKLLYSEAFRAPAIENLASNPAIVPERTRVLEAELGWQASENLYAAVNGFDGAVDHAIVYTSDVTGQAGTDIYQNYARTGSAGIETDLRWQSRRLSASASYAFYSAAGLNRVDLYQVPGRADLLLGFAAHKVSGRATLRLPRRVDLTATASWLSERYGFVAVDASGSPVAGRIAPRLDLGLFAAWRDAFVPGVELGVGVHDLLDQGAVYVVPYRASGEIHPPLPGPSREVIFRLAYQPS
jgi:outer membrane cobalamin receptor